jgi:hypothetical protein
MPSAAPVSSVVDVAGLNLESGAGVRALLAAVLRQLATLPLDTRVANAISQTVTAQRAVIETSDLEARLTALEASAPLRRTR